MFYSKFYSSFIHDFIRFSLHQHASVVMERLVKSCDIATLDALVELTFQPENLPKLSSNISSARVLSAIFLECSSQDFTSHVLPFSIQLLSKEQSDVSKYLTSAISQRTKFQATTYDRQRLSRHLPSRNNTVSSTSPSANSSAASQKAISPSPPEH